MLLLVFRVVDGQDTGEALLEDGPDNKVAQPGELDSKGAAALLLLLLLLTALPNSAPLAEAAPEVGVLGAVM